MPGHAFLQCTSPVHPSTAAGFCQVMLFNSVPLLSILVLLQAPSTSCFSTVYLFCPPQYCCRLLPGHAFLQCTSPVHSSTAAGFCQVMLFNSVPLLSTQVLRQASDRSCFLTAYLSCPPKDCSRLLPCHAFDSVPLLSTQVLLQAPARSCF